MDKKSNYGCINEQGYPVGQFGFNVLSEADSKKLKEDELYKKKKPENKNEEKE